jgi:hypothetical protein
VWMNIGILRAKADVVMLWWMYVLGESGEWK